MAGAQERGDDEDRPPPFELLRRRPGPSPDANRIHIPESRVLEIEVDQAAAAEAAGEWGAASRLYIAILGAQSDPPEGIQHVRKVGPSRWLSYSRYIRERLYAFPEEGRKAFRAHADPAARSLFEAAAARGDARALEALWRTTPIAGCADEALERLGDLALEAGRGRLAAAHYGRAARLPGSDLDPKRLEAKAARARKVAGFGLRASGFGSGPASGPAAWPVAGGDAAHAATLPALPAIEPRPRASFPVPASRAGWSWTRRRARAFDLDGGPEEAVVETLPVAAGGLLVLATGSSAVCYDLGTGERRWIQTVWEPRPNQPDGVPNNLYWSATIAGARVFAPFTRHVSAPELYRGIPIKEAIAARRLIAFDLVSGKRLWDQAESDDPFLRAASIGLPPVERAGVLYASAVLREGSYKCYLLALEAATGKLLWRRFLGSGQVELTMFGEPAVEALFMQPAEDGADIFLATGFGHVAAVSAITGEVQWLSTYETIPIEPARTYYATLRDLVWRNAPPVCAEGVVVVAPVDAAKAFAFDQATGELRWAVESSFVRRLLGIDDAPEGPRVVFQGDRLHAYDLRTGKLVTSFPKYMEQAGLGFAEEEAGRGLICGGVALVPLPTRIARVDVRSGERLADLPLAGGNRDSGTLLYLGGDLISVNSARASVFAVRESAPQTPAADRPSNPEERR